MKEWFQHDHNARNDLKLQLLAGRYGYEGLGVYWAIIEIMHEHCDRIATALLTHSVMLCARMHAQYDPATRGESHYISMIDYMVELGLFARTTDDDDDGEGYIYSHRVEANLAKYKDLQDKARKAANKRHQRDASAMHPQCERSATAMQIDKNRLEEIRVEETTSKSKRQRTAFVAPSLDECRAYAADIQMRQSQAEEFYDFYESKGWMVGRSPMKDWRAAMRRWKRTSPPLPATVIEYFQQHPAYLGEPEIAALEAERFGKHYEGVEWKTGSGQRITDFTKKADQWIANNRARQ